MNKLSLDRTVMPVTMANMELVTRQRDYARHLARTRLDKLREERQAFQEQLDAKDAQCDRVCAAYADQVETVKQELASLDIRFQVADATIIEYAESESYLKTRLATITDRNDELANEARALRDQLAGMQTEYANQYDQFRRRFEAQADRYRWLFLFTVFSAAACFLAGMLIARSLVGMGVL